MQNPNDTAVTMPNTAPNQLVTPAAEIANPQGTPNAAASFLTVIARAAADPTVNVEKMEKLLDMQERVVKYQAEVEYNAAMAEMQAVLPVITERGEIKDRDKKVQSKYAKFEDINNAVKPILQQYGFAISFRTDYAETQLLVTAVLSHRAGHREQTTIRLPYDQSGSKNAVQAVGSSISYGKRYTMCGLLNITTGGEDDDGQAAVPVVMLNDDQRGIILRKLDEAGKTAAGLCEWAKVQTLADIPASKFDAIIARLNAPKKA